MKKPTIKEDETASKEWINQTLRKIYRKMVEMYNIDFTYFRDIKIIRQSEILKQLTERMRNNLKENGIICSDVQWKQISESLSKNPATWFFENLAFYNPEDDVLYMNEKMLKNHPEKIIPVCTHELSEKLLSTYLPSNLKTSTHVLVKAYVEAEKTNNPRKLHELLNMSVDIVFKSVFKEGICEAVTLQTLRHADPEMKVESLEKELEIGHSKCIDILFDLEKAKRNVDAIEKNQNGLHGKRRKIQVTDGEKPIKETLGSFQIIKGISYYLGYPLAKAVLEKYGIKGIKLALENHPPSKAQYFAEPQTYLALLEKLIAFEE